MMLGAIFGSGSVESLAEDQQSGFDGVRMMAPQICGGKTWSSTAKAAGWRVETESRVCRATAKDDAMILV